MKRAGRVHGLRTLGSVMLVSLIAWGGIEGYGTLRASALVESLKTANTTGVPALIEQLRSYRRWAGRPLSGLLSSTENDSDQHLHASLANLALLPVDGSQADYLFNRSVGFTQRTSGDLGHALQSPSIHQDWTSALDRAGIDRSPGRTNAFMPPVPWRATPPKTASGTPYLRSRWPSDWCRP